MKKFRAWDNKKKKFEYFQLVDSHSIITTLPIPSMGKWKNLEPFEQVTGLKDIYENDIAEALLQDGDTITGKIVFENWSWGIDTGRYFCPFSDIARDEYEEKIIKIIGNIYD